MKSTIDKSYVSDYDAFLAKFDNTHEKSASQLEEIKKHRRIAQLRDNKSPNLKTDKIWEEF